MYMNRILLLFSQKVLTIQKYNFTAIKINLYLIKNYNFVDVNILRNTKRRRNSCVFRDLNTTRAGRRFIG
jgi:hypothetical protein